MHGNNTHLYDQDIARWGQATAVDKDLAVQIGPEMTRDLLKSLTFLQRNILGPWSCTTCVPAAVPHQQAAARWWRGGGALVVSRAVAPRGPRPRVAGCRQDRQCSAAARRG